LDGRKNLVLLPGFLFFSISALAKLYQNALAALGMNKANEFIVSSFFESFIQDSKPSFFKRSISAARSFTSKAI
jgi:hypothetical protein